MRRSSHAFLVGAGYLLSRIAGLIRERIFAHYFGNSDVRPDAFKAAFRIPVPFRISSVKAFFPHRSFPFTRACWLAKMTKKRGARLSGRFSAGAGDVDSRRGRRARDALSDRCDRASISCGEKRELTIRLNYCILFPGAGLLVFSAWCPPGILRQCTGNSFSPTRRR